MIGVDRGVVKRITDLIPDYMVMGKRGMADMGEMKCPSPTNLRCHDDRPRPLWWVEMGYVLVLKVVDQNQATIAIRDGTNSQKHPSL